MPLKTAFICVYTLSALSLVSQLGPVKSESIKAWSIKSFSLYLFVTTEQNRTEQNRTETQDNQGTGQRFCILVFVPHRHCSSQSKKTARIEGKNSSTEK